MPQSFKKIFVAALLCLPLFAEPDNGKFLPDAELLVPNHVLFDFGGGMNFPLEFFNQGTIPMTSYGGNFFVSVGYNWSGWLLSLKYTHDMWGEGQGAYALMENFRTNIFELTFRKIISKKAVSWFPSWIEVIPWAGVGVNFITTDYYPSVRAKEEGRLNSVSFGQPGANCLFYNGGLELALRSGTDTFIPYIGADYNAFYDVSIGGGFAGYPKIYAGIRFYPLGMVNDVQEAVKARKAKAAASRVNASESASTVEPAPAPSPEPESKEEDEILPGSVKGNLTLSVTPAKDFTPDEDGVNDTAFFIPKAENFAEGENVESWTIKVLDQKGNQVIKWDGKDKLPAKIEWDGKSENGEIVFSRNEYTIEISVRPLEKDRIRTGKEEFTAKTKITTGILFQVIIPDKKWKIVVNTIHFDPDKETFDKIPEVQRRENYETVESIARQIKEHGHVHVVVEGYANNVTNTERENVQELIPLSRLRARTIMEMLIQNGLDEDLLAFEGKGGLNPIAEWKDRDNWWKNRRVEFVVTKDDE